jgi:E3 ubiquitin-protein ligase TRIP12
VSGTVISVPCYSADPVRVDGIFDPRQYSDKIHNRYLKAKAKVEKHGKVGAEALSEMEELVNASKTQANTPDKNAESNSTSTEHLLGAAAAASMSKARKELERAQEERIEQLRANPSRINLFIRLLMPVLVELYSASTVTRVRSKVLNGLVKALAFSESDQLRLALKVINKATCIL